MIKQPNTTKRYCSIVIFALTATGIVGATPIASNQDSKALANVRSNDESSNELFNDLSLYDPIVSKYETPYTRQRSAHSNVIRPIFTDLERESSNIQESGVSRPEIVKRSSSADQPDMERVNSIAFNSREIRLVGPDRKPVEMKDDMATKIMVALENLQKDATEVWGQVNEKLDKGWKDVKAMVEDAVAPSSAQKKAYSSASNSRYLREAKPADASMVINRDVDVYSMADDDSSSLKSQAESAGAKVKSFFSNIGFNEENQKKAGDALTKAGSAVNESVTKDLPVALKKAGDAVSESVTKDLPVALKKAGDAVSETVTKDIPDAFKNFFG